MSQPAASVRRYLDHVARAFGAGHGQVIAEDHALKAQLWRSTCCSQNREKPAAVDADTTCAGMIAARP